MANCKHDFYQTETNVVVTVMKRGVKREECEVKYSDGVLSVLEAGEQLLTIRLLHPIEPNNYKLHCLPSKIEITMVKAVPQHWESLEVKEEEENAKKGGLISWDALAKELDKDKDEDEGDIDSLFKAIYEGADDDTRKAMLKSYTESHGTVLSTNWSEVSQKRTECKPPDGMEFKTW